MISSLVHLDERTRDVTIRAQNAGLPRRYLDEPILLRVFTALQSENVETPKRRAPASCQRCARERNLGLPRSGEA